MEMGRVILDFVGVLIWPAAVIAIAVMFRREFRSVIARLSRADLPGGVSLGFDYETERLSATESRKKALSDQSTLPAHPVNPPSPLVRPGEIPIDDAHGIEHAYVIEQLALTKLEYDLNKSIERSIRFTKGEKSLALDGLIRSDTQGPDSVVEVKWLRNPALVRAIIELIPQFQERLENYKAITGRPATLLLTLVVPERIQELVEQFRPLARALADTDWRVIVLDYEDIGFPRGSDSPNPRMEPARL
jgi:hypothetical protein